MTPAAPASADLRPVPATAAAPAAAGPHAPRLPGGAGGQVTHAPYRREPYIRYRTPSQSSPASVIDGKAAAWTRTAVLLHWVDDDGRAHNKWVPAELVRRVPRDESAWQDPYDDWSFYYPHLSAPRLAAAA